MLVGNLLSNMFVYSEDMSFLTSPLLDILARLFAVFLVANEIRGIILTAPVFYGLYQAGGSLMAIWMAICSLGGIALSVVVPLFAAKKIKRLAVHAKGIESQ